MNYIRYESLIAEPQTALYKTIYSNIFLYIIMYGYMFKYEG